MAVPTVTTDASNYGNQPGSGPLRVGGVEATPAELGQANLPSTLSPSAQKQVHALVMVRDLYAGPEKVRDAGQLYLPQAPAESAANYRARLLRSVFFNVFAKTVKGLVGFVFRKDPVLSDDVPAPIKTHWENIDNAGTHGDVLANDLMIDAMTAGHAAILVEFPDAAAIAQTIGRTLSLADEAPLRPYWVPIKKDNLLSWRSTIEHGARVLTQVVIKECNYVPVGDFGEKEQTQYRVLYRENGVVGWRLLAIADNQSVIEIASGVYANQPEIPIAEIWTSGKQSLFESTPPLIDLAYLNVSHYQMDSDYKTSIHKTCVPIFVTTGDQTEGPLVIGPNDALRFPDPQAKAEYVSHGGQALGATKNALDDIKQDMASLGLAMLATEKRVAETAEAKRIGKADTDSSLSVTARGLQDGIERALQFHANYLKLESGGSITINREFDDMTMPADLMTAWATLATALEIPIRVVLEALQRGGRIDPGEDLDALEQEIAANQAAKADQEAQMAQDRATMAVSGAKPAKAAAVNIEYGANGRPAKLVPA